MANRIRITAGLGQYKDFELLARAGVDEVFCGFVPLDWQLRYGNALPLNRREVRFVHVQAGSLQDLEILAVQAAACGVRVSVTFNSLYYKEEQLPVIAGYIRELTRIGIWDFIVADLGLALYLREQKVACRLHISGELGEWNLSTLRMLVEEFETPVRPGRSSMHISAEAAAGKGFGFGNWKQAATEKGSGFGAWKRECQLEGSQLHEGQLYELACIGPVLARVIFHRKNSLLAMSRMTVFLKSYGVETEAFLLNEMCHYTGGFCNSLHCDEMVHMCQVPYEVRGNDTATRMSPAVLYARSGERGQDTERGQSPNCDIDVSDEPGGSGCGLCALWEFQKMGIDYVKIVGRGQSAELMAKGIKRVHEAMEILKACMPEKEVRGEVLQSSRELDQKARLVPDKFANNLVTEEIAHKKAFLGRIQKLQEKVCGMNCYYAEIRQ